MKFPKVDQYNICLFAFSLAPQVWFVLMEAWALKGHGSIEFFTVKGRSMLSFSWCTEYGKTADLLFFHFLLDEKAKSHYKRP